jgi:protein O-mannosyl-transferase
LKYFKHALKLDANSVPANFGMGKLMHALTDNVGGAIPFYEKVIKIDPQHYKAHCQLGIVYLERNNLERAAEYLKTALALNPKHVPGLVAMGNLLFETGHSKHAAKYHQTALKFNPKEV